MTGARSDGEAHRAARKVADSLLVKCSINGADPYWGRVASELGSAGVDFDMDRLTIAYGGTTVCRGGIEVAHDRGRGGRPTWPGRWSSIECGLGLADGTGVVHGRRARLRLHRREPDDLVSAGPPRGAGTGGAGGQGRRPGRVAALHPAVPRARWWWSSTAATCWRAKPGQDAGRRGRGAGLASPRTSC